MLQIQQLLGGYFQKELKIVNYSYGQVICMRRLRVDLVHYRTSTWLEYEFLLHKKGLDFFTGKLLIRIRTIACLCVIIQDFGRLFM